MRKYFIAIFFIIGPLFAESSIDWIEPPKTDYHQIIGSQAKEIDTLNRLVEAYHGICKCLLTKRIEKLEEISAFLAQLMQDETFAPCKSTLNLLNELVTKKGNYLKKLTQLPSDEEIEAYHCDTSYLGDSNYQAMILRKDLNFSLKMREFWGAFWLETVDPCHRRLGNHYHHWLNTNPSSKTYFAFFLWLEKKKIDTHIPVVRYFDDQELEDCRLSVLNGRLMKKLAPLTTQTNVRNLFVIDLKKELFLAAREEGVWHTSLSRGRPVLASGLLDVENGIVTRVAFESGHYLPDLSLGYQTLQLLVEKGVSFSDPFEVIYFEDRKKYKIPISKECLFEYNAFIYAIHDSINREQISNDEF